MTRYDFTNAPMDGPNGRGLMLKAGVVIRGDAPGGKQNAFRDGKLGLRTRFMFGFRKVGGGKIPRDWGLIGLMPGPGQGLHQIDNVGVCWVHCVGATVYFGPEVSWGKRWGDGAWKRVAGAVNGNWRQRVPNGTHPISPYTAGGGKYVGVGSGRLVFGCVFDDATVDAGNLDWGHHPQRFCSRVGVYGDRVLVANNVIPKSKSVFKLGGQLYDYGKTIGIDINKAMLGVVRDEGRCPGYFAEGVVCRDNWVYNHRKVISRERLEDVVRTNDKQRFSFSPDGSRIRARQGHSVPVELGLVPIEPPELLYRGTVDRFLPSIRRVGLVRGKRHHVHLSGDAQTATRVGQRRGRPIVLVIEAGRMYGDRHLFYRSENGVWLTDSVPIQYLRFPDEHE